nr:CD1871A family CXXC motif-containing protein [Clostridium lundense]
MKTKIRMFLFTIGISFIGFGMYRGEVNTVLTKAINICLECIGIG